MSGYGRWMPSATVPIRRTGRVRYPVAELAEKPACVSSRHGTEGRSPTIAFAQVGEPPAGVAEHSMPSGAAEVRCVLVIEGTATLRRAM